MMFAGFLRNKRLDWSCVSIIINVELEMCLFAALDATGANCIQMHIFMFV